MLTDAARSAKPVSRAGDIGECARLFPLMVRYAYHERSANAASRRAGVVQVAALAERRAPAHPASPPKDERKAGSGRQNAGPSEARHSGLAGREGLLLPLRLLGLFLLLLHSRSAPKLVDRHLRLVRVRTGIPVLALIGLVVRLFQCVLADEPLLQVRPERLRDRRREGELAELAGVLERLADEHLDVGLVEAADGS